MSCFCLKGGRLFGFYVHSWMRSYLGSLGFFFVQLSFACTYQVFIDSSLVNSFCRYCCPGVFSCRCTILLSHPLDTILGIIVLVILQKDKPWENFSFTKYGIYMVFLGDINPYKSLVGYPWSIFLKTREKKNLNPQTPRLQRLQQRIA